MRRLLTGYAISFNRRHSRHGYLFQDRYKSVVCDEDNYFRELIRYIHLNPIRTRVVENISLLDRYPWCGHAVLMGHINYPWQDCDYVLSWFGTKDSAQKAYHKYVSEGISKRGEIESKEGQSFKALGDGPAGMDVHPTGNEDSTDRRILGNETFAAKVRREIVHKTENHWLVPSRMKKEIQKLIEGKCRQENINPSQLRMGSRRHPIGKVRSDIAWKLAIELGVPSVEIGYQLGITPSAVSKILQRRSR